MSIDLIPRTFPLHGSRLIEASAGTGKTWTIAALYVRLILGHGRTSGHGSSKESGDVSEAELPTAFARPLQPAEILVMTFTRSATRELLERIRERLLQTAKCFRGVLAEEDSDDFLKQLLTDYAGDAVALDNAAHRLALAAEAMDDSAVFTIDAWCHRMLQEHAFDSGALFDEELVDDEAVLYHDAIRDYWRSQVYALSDTDFDDVVLHWKDLEALESKILRELVRHAKLLPKQADGETLSVALRRGRSEQVAIAAELKREWVALAPALESWFLAHREKIKRNIYVDATVNAFFSALNAWVITPEQALPGEGFDNAADKWDIQKLTTSNKKGTSYTPPAGFAQIAVLKDALETIPTTLSLLMAHAAQWIDARMQAMKTTRHQFTFADMLARLKNGLEGENGAALRQRIIAQYPVALVDEFQDTSPDQYRILDCLYQVARNDCALGLFLIGDPKQAIYGFRGADIYSYLAARTATEGRHYRLGTNYRSTENVVAAVNHIFEQAEGVGGDGGKAGHPRGAFGFRTTQHNPLPFDPILAFGRKERLMQGEGMMPAMTICVSQREIALTKPQFQRQFAEQCAQTIVTWLNDETVFFSAKGIQERLRPADIAVLVRDRFEAAAMQAALRRRGVASVYLSDGDSVFKSVEAADVLRWLVAFASPLDGKLGRSAFATRTAGLPLALLQAFSTDDMLWELRIEELKGLQKMWQRQGVLAAIRHFLHIVNALSPVGLGQPLEEDATTDGWTGRQEGAGIERRLTNLLHLAELLQTQSRKLDGEHALIRWLGEQIDGDKSVDEHTLRLESDAQLVQIVTVFKAKGLEYPVVCLPFAVAAKPYTSSRRKFIDVSDAHTGKRTIDFVMSDTVVAAKEKARLEEDVRLLYVALTRARHALWCGVASVTEQIHHSALGYLLNGGQPITNAQLPEVLARSWGCHPAIAIVPALENLAQTRLNSEEAEPALALVVVYDGAFERDWRITSYTAISAGLQPALTPVTPAEEQLKAEGIDLVLVTPSEAPTHTRDAESVLSVSVSGDGETQVWHRFPRGALPGQFLHAQLEWIAANGFASVDSPTFAPQLTARCEQAGWGHRTSETITWLREVVRTVLPPLGVRLANLVQYQAEMEFWVPVKQMRIDWLDRFAQRMVLDGSVRPTLTQRDVTGMLRGFQDLVFLHEGRYWVLDYKSNALGQNDTAYHAHALASAVAHHRYDVQAVVYLLALHRLLKTRLGAGYEPAHHLGGVLFLFLRGIHHSETAGCHHVMPELALLDEFDQMVDGAVQTEEAA